MKEKRATTRNKRKSDIVSSLNFYTFIQNGLKSWSFEIPAFASCQTVMSKFKKRHNGMTQTREPPDF